MATTPTDETSGAPLRIEEAAPILRSGEPRLLGWTESNAIPCARVESRGKQYLVPLGVVSQVLPRLLAV